MSESRTKLSPGTTIRETYTIVEYLGSGRFADVYLVRHRYLGMQAMKLLIDTHDEEACHEAFHESFLLSQITHPGVVRVFDANRVGLSSMDCPYITMEYVKDGTLADLIDSSAFGLRPIFALDLILQIAHAVSHAHSMSPAVVHRDLKPANILLESELGHPVVRVADFGLAKAVNRFTDCVSAAGTLLYMSPESLEGYETPASDVFSMGLILHELLTGVLPFRKSDLMDCSNEFEIRKKLSELHAQSLQSISVNDQELGPDIDSLIGSMLSLSIEDRIQSAGEAAVFIEACLSSRQKSDEHWDKGPGRDPAEIGFRIFSDLSRRDEANEWFLKAIDVQPSLQSRLKPFMSMQSDDTKNSSTQ